MKSTGVLCPLVLLLFQKAMHASWLFENITGFYRNKYRKNVLYLLHKNIVDYVMTPYGVNQLKWQRQKRLFVITVYQINIAMIWFI